VKKIVFLVFLLFSFRLSAAIDSSRVAQVIQNGCKEFCHILDINDEAISSHKPEEMQFVIDVPVNYVHTQLEGHDTVSIFSDNTVKDSLNARIRRIYIEDNIELYIVVINSLDVIVHADFPANPTTNDLFVKKLYDDKSNLAAIRATHDQITQDIVSQSLAGHNRDCIVYSDAQYRGCFFANGKKGCWEYSVVSDHQGNYGYPKLSELQYLFAARLEINHSARSGGLMYMLPVVVDEFSEAAKYFQLEAKIQQAWTPHELDSIFREFKTTLDYEHLTLNDRKHAISVYTGYAMSEGWFGYANQEGHVINILKYTPAKDVHELLYLLSQSNELKNNPNYHGDTSDDALIKKLIDKTDDVGIPWFSTDNYTALIQTITQLELSSEQTCEENLPEDDAGWQNRNIEWKTPAVLAPIGTLDYEAAQENNGTITVTRKIVSSWNKTGYNPQSGEYTYQPVWSTDVSFNLKPFDLIYFTNRSSMGMLEAVGAHQGQICVAPAIILKYASDKSFNQALLSGVATTLDALTLVTGPGLIIKAAEAGDMALAAFEALQFIGASGNVAANTISDPELQSLVDKYNMIVGIWGLSKIITSGVHLTVSYFSEAAAGELKAIPVSTAQEYENAFQSAGTKVDQLPENVKTQVQKMEEYLEGKSGVVNSVLAANAVSFEEFANTVAEFQNGANASLAQQSYNLWKEQKWGELEQLFTSHNFNGGYPPFYGAIYTQNKTLAVGKEFDRYGGWVDNSGFHDNGVFASPTEVPFEQRALPQSSLSKPFKKYRVLISFEVEEGQVIPWFNEPGMGIQYKFSETIDKLKQNGFIEEIQ
jgi:hypothetical protein